MAVATATVLFVAFGMVSVAFWGFFRHWPPNLTPGGIGAAGPTGADPGARARGEVAEDAQRPTGSGTVS